MHSRAQIAYQIYQETVTSVCVQSWIYTLWKYLILLLSSQMRIWQAWPFSSLISRRSGSSLWHRRHSYSETEWNCRVCSFFPCAAESIISQPPDVFWCVDSSCAIDPDVTPHCFLYHSLSLLHLLLYTFIIMVFVFTWFLHINYHRAPLEPACILPHLSTLTLSSYAFMCIWENICHFKAWWYSPCYFKT